MTLKDLFIPYKMVSAPRKSEKKQVSPYSDFLESFTRFKDFDLTNPEVKELSYTPVDYSLLTTKRSTTGSSGRIAKIQKSKALQFATFNQAFDQYLQTHPEDNDPEMRLILTNIAGHESGYKIDAQNPTSSALGYFLFIDGTRKRHSSISRELFAKDPIELISAAVSLYKSIMKLYITPNRQAISNRNLTTEQAVQGYWFRPVSMLNYLKNGHDAYADPQGTTLEKVWASY